MELDRLDGGLADPGLLATLRLTNALAALHDRAHQLGIVGALVDVFQALEHFELLGDALVALLYCNSSLPESQLVLRLPLLRLFGRWLGLVTDDILAGGILLASGGLGQAVVGFPVLEAGVGRPANRVLGVGHLGRRLSLLSLVGGV